MNINLLSMFEVH